MTNPQTAKYVATNFRSLQGLTGVPMGALLILVGLGKRFRWPAFQWDSPLINSLLIIALMFIIGSKYLYQRSYGTVQPKLSMKKYGKELLGIIVIFGFIYLDITFFAGVPISFTVLGFSCYFFFYAFFGEFRRRDYLICGALLAAAALSPLLQITLKTDLFLFGWLNYLSLGIAAVVGGLFDHRFLAHTLTASSGA
jgi:hypothetical protein